MLKTEFLDLEPAPAGFFISISPHRPSRFFLSSDPLFPLSEILVKG